MEPAPQTRSLRLANLEVLVNSVLYNPAAALHTIDSHGKGLLKLFFDRWFDAVKNETGLPRVHDKKLSILAMCGLLDLDPSEVPQTVQQGWSGIVAGILTTFKTLPKALEGVSEIFHYFFLKFHFSLVSRFFSA